MSGRSPDYILSILDKETDERGRVGVAWNNPSGSIGIVLNTRVVITANKNLVLTLFPNTPYEERSQAASKDQLSNDDNPF
jgi:hypothetical protein